MKSMIKLLLISFFLGALVARLSFLLPVKYKAFNTFYVDRLAEETRSDYFTYEGIYSQQTAERFTDSVKGLIKSYNLLGVALDDLGYENIRSNRKKIDKSLVVRKIGPQVLYVQVKGDASSGDVLTSVTRVLERYINEINSESQKRIIFKKINAEPVVEEVSNYPFLNGTIVFLGVMFLGVGYIEFKRYLKRI